MSTPTPTNRRLYKLSPDQVREIRALRAQGWTTTRLAQHFGVTTATVIFILQGKRRSNVR